MVKKILAKCFVYLVLLLMYAPILVLIIFSFTTARSLGQWDGFSFKLYLELFKDEKIMTALWNTLLVAISSAVVATIIGTLGSIGTFYSKKRMKGAIKAVEQVQIATPEIVIALSLTILFVAISSVLRGYFQGVNKFSPCAISNIVEQFAKLVFGLVLSLILIQINLLHAIIGAIVGIVISELISFIILYVNYNWFIKNSKNCNLES